MEDIKNTGETGQNEISGEEIKETENSGQDTQKAPEPETPKKEKPGEFSLQWHLKVLAVIYVVLGVFYIVLKIILG